MKFKKIILTFLIILMGLGGSLFGCTPKPLKLIIKGLNGEDFNEISQISLVLPSQNGGQTDDDNTSDKNDEAKDVNDENDDDDETSASDATTDAKTNETDAEKPNDSATDGTTIKDGVLSINSNKTFVYVVGENANKMFENGLIISVSEQNVVSVNLDEEQTNKYKDCYVYSIEAMQPKFVAITFKTKDEKTYAKLDVNISQDCDKIEKNVHSENFVVKGKTTQFSSTIVNFEPSTTTNKNLIFKFSESVDGDTFGEKYYENKGLKLDENGLLSFLKKETVGNADELVYDGSIKEFYVDIYHIKCFKVDENGEFVKNAETGEVEFIDGFNFDEMVEKGLIVKNVKFDILEQIDDIVATISNAKISSIEFATNLSGKDYREITIKKIVKNSKDNSVKYEDIDDSYIVKYALINAENELVGVSKDDFKLTISQNGRDGQDVLEIWIENSVWGTYSSNKIQIPIVVRTYPNFISVNGVKTAEQTIVVYDNGESKCLEINVSESFNTDFIISDIYQNLIAVKYENGNEIDNESVLESPTKIYVSCADFIDFGSAFKLTASFKISSVVSDAGLETKINVEIVKNLVNATISFNNKDVATELNGEISASKTDTLGKNTVLNFAISATETGAIIPDFEIEIENSNILQIENLNLDEKTFTLKTVITGETFVHVRFDNGLVETFKVKVFSAINDVSVDFSESSKKNIGQTEDTSVEVTEKGEVVKVNNTSTASGTNELVSVKKYYIKNGTISDLSLLAVDKNGKTVYDKYLIDLNYETKEMSSDDKTAVAISNIDNKLYALKVTTNDIIVTAKIKAMVFDESKNDYVEKTVVKYFVIKIYEPVKNLTLSESYVELYTSESLGYFDQNKSKVTIEVSVDPANATNFNNDWGKITLRCAKDTVEYEISGVTSDVTDEDVYVLNENKITITAKGLGENKTSETMSVTFSITDLGAVYTKRVIIKVMVAQKPERINVENVSKIEDDDGKTVDYLYFNMGLDEKDYVSINPVVYPLTSLNNDYVFEIENDSSNLFDGDVIKFDKQSGEVTATHVGKCKLILIPKGCVTDYDENNNKYSYDKDNARVINIVVADGEEIAYSIKTKKDLMMLCGESVVDENTESKFIERFSKKYVLEKDIDLSGEKIVSIGSYEYENRGSELTLKVQEFTGSFSGKFEIGGASKQYSITGVRIEINSYSDAEIGTDGDCVYAGLFAKNKGTISDLNVVYSVIDVFASRTPNPIKNASEANEKAKLYFGGISAINGGVIANCTVKINSGKVETYFVNNFVGMIVGLNDVENIQNGITKNGEILNAFASGNLNVVDGFSINNKDPKTNLFVGGIAGQNEGIISGNFNVYNLNDEIFNKNLFNATMNLTSLNNGNLTKITDLSAFGGICGQNNGTIKNMASYGKIFAQQNIGGICGINVGTIGGFNEETETKLGCLSASMLYGETCVGGLVGKNKEPNTGTNNYIIYNGVMLLDDGDNVVSHENKCKIYGQTFVAGLIGKNENGSLSLSNNFVRSYVQKEDGYYDIFVENASFENENFGGLYSGDISESKISNGKITIEDSDKNFADNLKIGYKQNSGTDTSVKEILTNGDVSYVGIKAPTSIEITLNESNLNKNTVYSYNKFIAFSNAEDDEKTLILFFYQNDKNSTDTRKKDCEKYNYYLKNQLFRLLATDENGNKVNGFYKIESLNPEILTVDTNGNFKVIKTGETTVKIYSMLNKSACDEIKVKIIDVIEDFKVFEDGLNSTQISTLYVEKESSKNIYLNENLMQKDLFVKFDYDQNYIKINSGEEYVSALNALVVFGKENGTIGVNAKLFVKVGENFIEISSYEYAFNIVVSRGLQEFSCDTERANLVANSFVNFGATIETDLVDKTNIIIKQYYEKTKHNDENDVDEIETVESEFLNYELDKIIGSGKINLEFKVSPNKNYLNEIYGKTIKFKIYVVDSLVSLSDIENDEAKFAKYVKTVEFVIEKSGVINAEMIYFADGEVRKNENGTDVINTNELESEFIKIGKVGILKILVYPKEILTNENNFVLTYENSDNLNLSFQQVKKSGDGYVDVITSTLVEKGIKLDLSELLNNADEQYLYVKLLTDSPIKENSKFNLKLKINGFDYSFEKTLTSALASNLILNFDGAVLNNNGDLESVYAKGVEDQILSLTVNKLTEYYPKVQINLTNLSGANYVEVMQYRDPVKISEDSVRYDFILKGLNYVSSNDSVEIYFYIDKTVNNKTERYKSNTLKLNIVDFIVKGISVENVQNGYLSKPVGTSYPLKIKLETIYNGSSEVLNLINALEEKISKSVLKDSSSQVFSFNGENLTSKEYLDFNFEILKQDGYFMVKPTQANKFAGFSASATIKFDGNDIELISDVNSKNNIFMNNGIYCKKFAVNFGGEFYIQTDINNPVPIYSAEEFCAMKQNGHYILMNDIVLEKDENVEALKNGYTPFDANFASLDGNLFGITIKNLNIDLSETLNEFKFGLFNEIGKNTIVKNLTVKFDLQESEEDSVIASHNKLNFENISSLVFGTLAGINKGLVYNCEVSGIKNGRIDQMLYVNMSNIINDEQTSAYIGGFVGKNEGIITNSRSELMLCVSRGFVGGFVCENTGTISSSYYKNMIVKNLGEDDNSSKTAGFVCFNEGRVKFSYVEGNEDFAENGIYLCDTSLNEFTLSAPTSIGGFVFRNSGEIEDCYANLSISSQSYSGGFVYANTGTINRSFAGTINEKSNNVAHAPFLATKESFDENDMKTKIVDCFYENTNKSAVNDAFVTGLDIEQFNNEYYLTNFVFDNDETIWMFRKNSLPTLVEANNVAKSKRTLYKITETADGGVKYSYIYSDGYYAGSKINPIIISNEEEFIEYFAVQSKTNSQYYRLINNINFSDYTTIPTYTYVFSGMLDGNGLEISNIRVSAPADYSNENFGLFASIEKYAGGLTPIVKNLEILPLEVYANNSLYVGTLAGFVKDANIVNINVDGDNVIVQGRNIVGGVVGYVCGESNIINITSNVSANSNYSSVVNINKNDGYNLFYSYEDENENLITNAKDVSYAGAICGVVDTTKTETVNERIRNLKVSGGAKVFASFGGLVCGLVCENSGLDNVKVIVNSSSYVNVNYAGSLVCGENRGYISRAEVVSNGKVGDKLFRHNAKFIGGIVGFNNNGTIVNSISGTDVIGNSNTISAGGVVGLSVGGAISSVIAYGDVWSSQVIGGIIGLTARQEMFKNCDNEYKIANIEHKDDSKNILGLMIKTNNIVYVSNCVAINNFAEKSLKYLDDKNNEYKKCYIGAIIGAAHNTPISSNSEISIATKNSYIAYNNFFKNQTINIEYTVKTTNESGKTVEEKKNEECSLLDFGVNNIQSFNFAENASKNVTSVNPMAEGKDKIFANEVFKNWSKNVFDFAGLNEINEKNLPKLKSVNNINTKTLEGKGTYADPYVVESIRAINELSEKVKDGEKNIYVSLKDNIDATGKEFESIGDGDNKFVGTFSGNGYFINGLTYFNRDDYNTQTYFGLFGYVSNESKIQNLNVVANFVINFVQPLNSASITATGIIAGYNEGYIENCNVYGGIIATLKNQNSKVAISYVGGICGINGGQFYGTSGIVRCYNYATIYLTINDVENSETNNIDTVYMYAGFITGANLNQAIINKCENLSTKNLDINKGAQNNTSNNNGPQYTLIVINDASKESCQNFVNTLAGYVSESGNVYGDNNDYTEDTNIYDLSYAANNSTGTTLTLKFDVDSQLLVNDVIYVDRGCEAAMPTIDAEEYGLTGYVVKDWYLEPTFKTKVEFPYKLTRNTILYGYWTYEPHESLDEGFYTYLDKFSKHSSSYIVEIDSRDEFIKWFEYVVFEDVTESKSDEYKIKVTYITNTKENWNTERKAVFDIVSNARNIFHNTIWSLWNENYARIYVKDEDSYLNNLATINVSTDNDSTTVTKTYSQTDYALGYYKTDSPRENDYDNFKINNIPDTRALRVSSSTQLIYVLEHGLKPICVAGSPAEKVYNRAKEILRSICDDDMTDYQKLYAIYDWLVSNVQYEHGAAGDDVNIEDWEKYQEWFAEGPLLNGKAVCDGYCKAAIVLARIEGIPIVKVRGDGHAWNKVCVDGNWYVFDATHGDAGITYNNVHYETLSHTEFLTTDEYKISCEYTDVKHPEIVCNTKNDFYSNAEFSYGSYTFDLKIDTANDFNGLISYIEYYSISNKNFVLEFIVAGDYTIKNVTDKVKTLDGYNGFSWWYRDDVNGYTRYNLLLFFK